MPEALREAPGTGCPSGFDCVFHAEAFALDDDGHVFHGCVPRAVNDGAVGKDCFHLRPPLELILFFSLEYPISENCCLPFQNTNHGFEQQMRLWNAKWQLKIWMH